MSQKYASSKGYSFMKPFPIGVFMPRRTGSGIEAANSLIGTSPRKRYIGFISELPPLIWSASRLPSASSSWANSRPASVVTPPLNPSLSDTLAVTATSPADLVAYGAGHLPAEPRPVLERAVPAVLAPVEARARGTTR